MGERRWRASRRRALRPSRPSCGRPTTTTCSGTRCWRTCTGPAEPAGGGGGLRPAAAGLRLHPRRAGRPDRPFPAADLQHPAAAQAAAGGQRRVAAGCSVGRPRPRPAGTRGRRSQDRLAHRIVAEGCRCARRGDRRHSAARRPRPAAPPRAGARRPALSDLAARLSDRFETRVKVALGQNKGKLTVEFASMDDLRADRGRCSGPPRTRPSSTDRSWTEPARAGVVVGTASRPSVPPRDRTAVGAVRGRRSGTSCPAASQRAGLAAPAPSSARSSSRA